MRTLALTALLAAILLSPAQAAPMKDGLKLPEAAQAFDSGEELSVNGQRMLLRGFVAPQRPDAVARWFKAQLDSPIVETRDHDRLIVSSTLGTRLLTIQIDPAGAGSRGLISTAEWDPKSAPLGRNDRWLSSLPPESKLLNHISSTDDGKLWQQMVASNRYNRDINRRHVIRLMRDEGLSLDQEANAATRGATPGLVLLFKGERKDGMAVIDSQASQTSVVINVVTAEARP